MDILVSNLQTIVSVDIPDFTQRAQQILRRMNCRENCEVSIVLVDDQEIRRLNREYRGIDRSTDVLSFAQQETTVDQEVQPRVESATEPFPQILGDVIISVETTLRQAPDREQSFEQELHFLLIHGVLHLLGYDHASDDDALEMQRLERELLNLLGEKNS